MSGLDLVYAWVLFAASYIFLSALVKVVVAYLEKERVDWFWFGRKYVYIVFGAGLYGFFLYVLANQ
jgi:hypothetical protein